MYRIAKRILAPLVLGGACGLTACAHEEARPPVVAPQPVSLTTTTSSPAATTPQSGVNVSEEILKACQIHFDKVETAPQFDFDRSGLRGSDRDLLLQVASCVTTGPLKGRSLELIGRADPRGEVEYNFALGESRAESVRSYLMALGVSDSKMSMTSRGKLDATGTDEAGWQRDRRVDLELR